MVSQTAAEFPSPNPPSSNSDFSLEWQTAQERVLLYLRACEIPAHQALEIALTALKQAQSSSNSAVIDSPPAVAMHRAFTLLGDISAGGHPALNECPGRSGFFSPTLNPVPPLKRGSMGARRNWNRPWLSRIFSLFRRSASRSRRSGTSLMVFFFGFFGLVILFLIIVPR
ncbi:MAG TPA: hypothetical protein PLG17_06165 [Thermodesulfobacteriota bacterium]|nr:hypothetical protein [Deltaproteobacteria bacterium]HOC39620.1 hypothetical protein [Thermodesulfobacteriota bacterium]HQO78082.1 hypothetical protein [Thermodesulfobacteriota bacterium]